VTNSTFSGNGARGRGGAIAGLSDAVTITNMIIAKQHWAGIAPIGTDGGHNIDDGTTCGFAGTGCSTASGSSLCNTDPQL
jgi:predicted outer membrane repeat protein